MTKRSVRDTLDSGRYLTYGQDFIVDARLSHFASGYDLAERVRNGRL